MIDDGDANTDNVQASVLYDADNAPIGFTVNDRTYYYLKNIQGDVLCVTDETGAPLANYVYDAWGSFAFTPASQSVSNQDLAFIATYNPVTYRGYLYDPELGYYYLQSRYYDPETGRFLNADGYFDTGMGAVSANIFSYCINTPTKYRDLTGQLPRIYSADYFSSKSVDYSAGVYQLKFERLFVIALTKGVLFKIRSKLYFLLNITVTDYVVKLNVEIKETPEQNCSYWQSFVRKDSYVEALIYGVRDVYLKYYNRSEMSGRTLGGLTFEFYMHIYLYYFNLDGRKHSNRIDFDTSDSSSIEWMNYEFIPTTSSSYPDFMRNMFIKDLRNAIIRGKESFYLSTIIREKLSRMDEV